VNWGRGLFRLWVIFSAFWIAICAAIVVIDGRLLGDLYLSSSQQSLDLLKSSMSLASIGTIAPKSVGRLRGRVSGVTDGKDDRFTPGQELQFHVRIRFSDEKDTIRTFPVTRRILSPQAAEPCPPSFTLAARPEGC
jgi:hypothetical protein